MFKIQKITKNLKKGLAILLVVMILITTLKFLIFKPKSVFADSTLGFNEGYGTTVKDLNSTLTGTITNAVWKSEEFCKVSKCLYFDGTGDLINFGNDSDVTFTTGSFTITGWFRTPDITSGQRTIVAKHNSTAGGYKVYIDSNGYLIFGIDPDSTWSPSDSASSSTTTVDDNKWHHFVAVKNSTTSISLYVDGNLMQTDSSITASSLTNSDTFYIGIDGNGSSNGFSGFLDEIKVYAGTARSAAEINADYLGETQSRGVTASFSPDQSYLSNGLVGYWKMDETTWSNANCGTTKSVLDSSGNANDGSSCPTSTGPTGGATGKFGNSGSFDGSNDYVQISNNSTDKPTSQIAVSAWIYHPSDSTKTSFNILRATNGASDQERLFAAGPNSSTLYPSFYLSLTNAGSATCQPTTTTLPLGSWSHMTGTYDGNTIRVYLNGNLTGSCSYPNDTLAHDSNPLFVGAVNSGSGLSYGKIDELRIYNRAISPAEVQKLYNWAPGPIGYWPFDENTGITTAYDKSGNGNNATFGEGGSETAITYNPWVQGKFGSAAYFTGGDNGSVAVVGTPATLAELPQLTLSAWVRSINASSNNDRIIDRTASGVGGWNFYLTSAEELSFIVDYDGVNNLVVESSSFTAAELQNVWHHVAVTWDGTANTSGVHLYIDGKETPYTTATNGDGNRVAEGVNSSIGIGRRVHSNNRGFFGTIDDVKIYNYPRNQSQIIEDMNGGHPAPGSPIGSSVAYWKFDEGYGTTAYDNSTKTNNLTLSTASWTNSGKFGKAWNGDGTLWVSRTNDADLDFSATEDFSLSGWFKSDSATNPANGTEYILSTSTGNTDVGYQVYAKTTGVICFAIDDDGTWTDVESCTTADYYDGTWHHFTAVRNVTLDKTYIYIDAQEKDSDTDPTTATLDGDNVFYIGDFDGDNNGTAGTEEFAGDIDEVKVFRSALTPDAIKVLYNQSSGANMGALSTDSSNNPSWSANDEYCPPGQGSTCTPPIGHWKMDENTGTSAFDSSGNGFTGTRTGTGNPYWASGKMGSSGYFNGTDDVVTVGDISSKLNLQSANPPDFTVTTWIKPATGTSDGGGIKLHGTQNVRFFYDSTCPSTACFKFQLIAGGTTSQSTIVPSLDTWYHIAETYTQSDHTMKLYVNGILQDTDVLSSYDLSASAMNVTFGYNEFYLKGGIDDVRIYNYARTPAQVAWDMNQGKPVGWWKLDENTGTTANDSMGNSTAGTLTNSPTWVTGKLNTGVSFAGSNQQILIADDPDFDFEDDENMSLTTWFKHSTASAQEVILSKYAAAGYKIIMESDGDITCGLDYDSTWSPTDSATSTAATYDDGSWHHIACVKTGATSLSLYIDGVLITTDSSITATNTLTNADPLYLGIDADGTSNDFTGSLDDVRIFRYPLTSQQIKTIMNGGSAVKY